MNPSENSPLSVTDAEQRLEKLKARFLELEARAVRLDIAEAIRQIPEKLAAELAPVYRGDVQKAAWFPGVADNVQKAVLAIGPELHSAEDVDRAVSAHALGILARKSALDPLFPLSQAKANGQRWAVDGVYDHSVLGLREVRFGGLLFRALSGEHRHRLLAAFRKRFNSNDVIHEIILRGVRDPLNPERSYWNSEAIKGLPNLFVSEMAEIVLWLSGLHGPVSAVLRTTPDSSRLVQRVAPGRKARQLDVDFLLRVTRQQPACEDEAELKRWVTLNWLFEKEDYWRNFTGDPEKGESLYGVIGRSIERDSLDELRQEETPIKDATLEWLAERDGARPRSAKKRSLSDYDGDSGTGLKSTWYSIDAFSQSASRRFQQIEAAVCVPGEAVEIETTPLAAEAGRPAANESVERAVVPWLEAGRFRKNFAERLQIKLDVEAAFRAVYGASPASRGSLSEIAIRDFRVFMIRYVCDARWERVADLLNMSPREADAARKSLERVPDAGRSRRQEICEWLQAQYPDQRRRTPISLLYYCINQWKADQAHQKEAITLEDGSAKRGRDILESAIRHCRDYKGQRSDTSTCHCRPEFLTGQRLPAVDISHDWTGTGNSLDRSSAAGTRVAM